MGENSKRSGEIGEALAKALLTRIGWKTLMQNVSIDCNTPTHLNVEGNARRTHGEDQIFLYHNPFHDDRSDIVHVSNKNVLGKHSRSATLRSQFKSHLKELHETIDCAKFSPKLRDACSTFGAKKIRQHSGLLIWLQNDLEEIERDIVSELSTVRLDIYSSDPAYVIDNARASFLLKVIDNVKSKAVDGEFSFYYPRIGTAISVDENRTGKFLPLELIAAEIIPAVVRREGAQQLVLYTNEPYSSESYKRMVAYGLNFGTGLVTSIAIGMPDFNPAVHQNEVNEVRMAFHTRTEEITAFSFNRSILDLLQENNQ